MQLKIGMVLIAILLLLFTSGRLKRFMSKYAAVISQKHFSFSFWNSVNFFLMAIL